MKIDWESLVLVAAVTLVASVVLVGIVSIAIRAFAVSADRVAAGQNGTAAKTVGIVGLVLASALVLFGIYLIVPIFR
jgi:hypothetical protein